MRKWKVNCKKNEVHVFHTVHWLQVFYRYSFYILICTCTHNYFIYLYLKTRKYIVQLPVTTLRYTLNRNTHRFMYFYNHLLLCALLHSSFITSSIFSSFFFFYTLTNHSEIPVVYDGICSTRFSINMHVVHEICFGRTGYLYY